MTALVPTLRRLASLLHSSLAWVALLGTLAVPASAADNEARQAAWARLKLDPAAMAVLRGDVVESDAVKRKQALGLLIFKDKDLSEPRGQSCADCHHFNRAFTTPGPTSPGANPALFGPRNAPSITYARFSPNLQGGGDEGFKGYFGGQFRDGRVDFLSDQAKLPLLNPIEMANPDMQTVVDKVAAARFAGEFKAVYGDDIFTRTADAYDAIADAIATFESSKLFARFDSKYDAYLRGETTLSDAEMRGLAVFNDPKHANCASCHISGATEVWGPRPLFTDFGYDNIGVPRNPENKFYKMPPQYNPDGWKYVDIGLYAVAPYPFNRARFKAPSLRNVAVTGPYMHNGYFKTLRGVLDFYNTRDVKPACANRFTTEADALAQGCWPEPEFAKTMNTKDLGNLRMSEQDIDDMMAYLATLTDGWSDTQ